MELYYVIVLGHYNDKSDVGGFDIDHEVSDDNSETITITTSFEDNSVASDQVIGIQTNPSSHQRFYPLDQFLQKFLN